MRIFVGHLASTTTEDELRQLFLPYELVTLVRIVTSRQTGCSLGYGYVEMPNATEAQAAMAGLQGTTLEGHTLTVNKAY
jgi:RNA recognition motif-containing protein